MSQEESRIVQCPISAPVSVSIFFSPLLGRLTSSTAQPISRNTIAGNFWSYELCFYQPEIAPLPALVWIPKGKNLIGMLDKCYLHWECSQTYSCNQRIEYPGLTVLEILSWKHPTQNRIGRVAQVLESLPSKPEALSSNPCTTKKKWLFAY
jgi:hypothetical protein